MGAKGCEDLEQPDEGIEDLKLAMGDSFDWRRNNSGDSNLLEISNEPDDGAKEEDANDDMKLALIDDFDWRRCTTAGSWGDDIQWRRNITGGSLDDAPQWRSA